MTTTNALITGWGMYAPPRVMTNDELDHGRHVRRVDLSRTGIRERRIAADDETTTTLTVHAARDALAVAGVDASEVDLSSSGTCSPDYPAARHRGLVAHELGATRPPPSTSGRLLRLPLRAGHRRAFIRSGMYRNVLVIGVEVLSRFIDWKDRNTCVLFGDGAGAVMHPASDQPGGMSGFQLFADGTGSRASSCRPAAAPARRRRRPWPRRPHVHMAGQRRLQVRHAPAGRLRPRGPARAPA